MTEEPLENASTRSVRAGQGALILLLITGRDMVSFPLQVKFIHVAGIIVLALLLAEFYLSLSRRSILPEEHEQRVNEFLFGVAQYPGAWPVKSVIKMAEKRNENIRRQRALVEAEQFLETVEEVVADDFGRGDWLAEGYDPETIADVIASRTEQTGPYAIKDVVSPEILALSTEERLVVTVLIIVRRQRATEGDIYDHKEAISQCLENFDFTHPGEAELKLLHGFDDLRSILDTGDDTEHEVTLETDVDDPEQTYEELMDDHYPFGKSYPEYDKTSLREYKENIAELVQAELSVGGAQSEILGAIQEERERLKRQKTGRSVFLLALPHLNWSESIDYQEDVRAPIARKFPNHITFGKKYPLDEDGNKKADNLPMSVWIIATESDYTSGDAFYNTAIDPLLPEEVIGRAARIRTPLKPDRDLEEMYDAADDPQRVDDLVSQEDILFEGEQEDEITLRAIENMVDEGVGAEDLLGAVQLDSVTDATAEESRAFSERRGDIEDELGIDSVFEWGDVSAERAGKEIDSLVDVGDQERWTELASSLIDTIRQCRPPKQVAAA